MSNKSAKFILSRNLTMILGFAVVAFSVYYLIFVAPLKAFSNGYELANKIGNDMAKALQFTPQIIIDNKQVQKAAYTVTELVTAEQKFSHKIQYSVSFLGSTKNLEIIGEFTAKAGIPVDDSFRVEVSNDGKVVYLDHKSPKLISCSLDSVKIDKEENGMWNKLTKEDREAVHNEMIRTARELAELNQDLKTKAVENLLERLRPLQQQYSFDTKSRLL